MAAPMVESPCRLCHGILPKKQRRTIFSVTFGVFNQLCEVLDHVPQPNDDKGKYVCGFCWNKLNKLSKIEYDLKTKLEALKEERIDLLKTLREKYNTQSSAVFTPKTKKRYIVHSPTPRKTKRSLALTPQRTGSAAACANEMEPQPMIESPVPVQGKEQQAHEREQEVKKKSKKELFSSKVPYRTKASKDKLARTIYSSSLKPHILACLLKDINKEMSSVVSTKTKSILRQIKCDSLANFSMDLFNQELQAQAPLTYKIISTLVKDSEVGTSVGSAVLLNFRNKHMSSLHHIITQVLDRGGATNETIATLNKLGLCVSTSSAAKQQQELLKRQMQHIEKLMLHERAEIEKSGMKTSSVSVQSSDIIGDNIDISRNPSQMSVDRRRKSWHWFLLVGLEKRIINDALADDYQLGDICRIDNSVFVPSVDDCSSLEEHFIFHIAHVLVKNVNCLKKYASCLPKFIEHSHIHESSQKSDYAILDILDKSENKSEDMISILQYIHETFIPHTEGDNPVVLSRKVFGGDVLTNERAYSAQLAMLNGSTDFDQLAGVIHRPEGLHRMMNLLLFIYQIFYKKSSAGDRGSLSYLRNRVGRIDVQGAEEVIGKYRSHFAFVEDCLDAHLVAAALKYLEIKDVEEDSNLRQPLFEALPIEEQRQFIYSIARGILDRYIKLSDGLKVISMKAQALDAQVNHINSMYDNHVKKFICQPCNRKYKTLTGMKKHLQKEHGMADLGEPDDSSSKLDHVAIYHASFMKCALLLRDTNDAYKMGDGDRVLSNSKFQMLLSRVGNHTKYQLWLFRYMANCLCLLTPRMAYEYKWNCSANLQGGLGNNIPCDNLVELLVQTVKKAVYAQGANATFLSVRKATLAIQVQDEIKNNIQNECDKKQSGKKRPPISKLVDISAMASELVSIFDIVPGREYPSFTGFKDVFLNIKVDELHKWLTKNKERLSYEIL